MSLGTWTQIVRLDRRPFYPLIHVSAPKHFLKKMFLFVFWDRVTLKLISWLCVWGHFSFIYVCATGMQYPRRPEDDIPLGTRVRVVNYCVFAGNQIWLLWRISQCSYCWAISLVTHFLESVSLAPADLKLPLSLRMTLNSCSFCLHLSSVGLRGLSLDLSLVVLMFLLS